ncbi:hypothetical protein E8E15_010455 [Penicillium rubens]|jgi:hypothetical protein|uniref:Pc21g09320 protein n=2 Tax=Penicillium chrysogenum species complex TaxID=254878 RepID=B6HN92_PENRW|nr:uncharacterized protein N7525_007521 [Penicillium rubens]KZN88643.1 hypothetical protein EN45_072200 [Penicillium chrysogenum]CAP95829.1 Pc21g09320 [Penicillium rubens Wisconsin 54-1255]KAF3027874.1 hypothetical protein E8E15_010455 [Penicillium rubens]KAJ5049242.1 hypothetical protein NUH16_007759 [Penicillium rubens]KAJ5829268.1 hypothetical protein N7525_007521 [Penicillium rubens]
MFPVRLNRDDRKSKTVKATKTKANKTNRKTSTKDPEDPSTARSSTSKRRSSMPGLERSEAASFLESRTSLPYPSFSKAHSKEGVRANIPTPDPTDLTHDDGKNGHRENHHAPPSPPLTGLDQESRKGSIVNEDEKEADKPKKKTNIKIRASEVNRSSSSLRSKRDDSTKSKSSKTSRAETPIKSRTPKDESEASPRSSSHKSKTKISDDRNLPKRSSRSTMSASQSNVTLRDIGVESVNGSDATSIAPNQQHSVPRKPMTPPTKPPSRTQNRSAMSHRHTASDESIDFVKPVNPNSFGAPPPPPPPPEMPATIPRVDYLLKNGGLENKVSRALLASLGQKDPLSQGQPQSRAIAGKIFDPYNRLLDDYQKVMNKNGSLAVATGYRSVARRLLDRLEAVFARDISSEPCSCQICDQAEPDDRPDGVSWGEVLELVSGRRELPMWPPFTMAPSAVDTGAPGDEHIPMQKLDVDVPDEYREHFIRQSRKTKVAVDKWLYEQNDPGTSAPNEVDDETLTFAMLTHLEPYQRSLFCSLLGINSSTPVPRSDEKPRPKPSALVSSASAIQRLYRLSSLPRDPETAMYMLNNPTIHHVLATLSAISDDEWEILISGRFDGFLRSGAEDTGQTTNVAGSRWGGSRSNTPLGGGISRGPTPNYMDSSFRPSSQVNGGPSSPASFGGPIALDEETEIAALAEVERDIFLGMEALEDAFEALHCKAETVRRALRERGAGLSVANQSRRGSFVEARMGTPFSGVGGWESGGEDDFLDDDRSLAPDDSASNISSNRRRRPKRRTERRTPAPVEEEDEEDDGLARRDTRNSRRR